MHELILVELVLVFTEVLVVNYVCGQFALKPNYAQLVVTTLVVT